MGDTQRYKVNAVDRKHRMVKSGKLPKADRSRRSDLIRAIADDLADEYGECDHDYDCDCELIAIEASLT